MSPAEPPTYTALCPCCEGTGRLAAPPGIRQRYSCGLCDGGGHMTREQLASHLANCAVWVVKGHELDALGRAMHAIAVAHDDAVLVRMVARAHELAADARARRARDGKP